MVSPFGGRGCGGEGGRSRQQLASMQPPLQSDQPQPAPTPTPTPNPPPTGRVLRGPPRVVVKGVKPPRDAPLRARPGRAGRPRGPRAAAGHRGAAGGGDGVVDALQAGGGAAGASRHLLGGASARHLREWTCFLGGGVGVSTTPPPAYKTPRYNPHLDPLPLNPAARRQVSVYPYWATLTGVLEALHGRRTRLRAEGSGARRSDDEAK